MLARLRARLTYANVVATLALFLALGGASYAAIRVGTAGIINNSVRTQDLRNNDIRGRDIRNRTIQNKDILTNTILGQQVRESTLSKVPDADKLDGQDSTAFKLSCPAGTQRHAGGCIETTSQAAASYANAARTCGVAGRRLPNADELGSFGEEPGIDLNNADEWAADRNDMTALTVDDGFTYAMAPAGNLKPFRCEAPLSN